MSRRTAGRATVRWWNNCHNRQGAGGTRRTLHGVLLGFAIAMAGEPDVFVVGSDHDAIDGTKNAVVTAGHACASPASQHLTRAPASLITTASGSSLGPATSFGQVRPIPMSTISESF